MGFSGDANGKESTCQCRRRKKHWFDPWVGNIPWRRSWQPTAVLLPGESPRTEEPGGLQTMGLQRADTTEQLSSHSTAHQIREKAEPGQ